MTQTKFQVDQRADQKPKSLRQEGIVPGNIYGKGDSVAVQMNSRAFEKLYNEVGETGLVYVQVGEGKTEYPVLVDEVQVDPINSSLVHVSFKQVDLTSKIKADVPVETVGKFEVPEAVLMLVKDEIEVEALPADLPEKFEVDVTGLTEIGQMITFKDLKYDRSKVELTLGEEGEDEPVVIVQEQQEEEPEEVPVEEGVEGEEGAATTESSESSEENDQPAAAEKSAENEEEKK